MLSRVGNIFSKAESFDSAMAALALRWSQERRANLGSSKGFAKGNGDGDARIKRQIV